MISSSDIPQTSGIYRIVCLSNGKLYIGSAIDLRTRWYLHLSDLRRNAHHSPKLQHAWNKYGEDTFILEIIEFVLPPFLLEREQYWLDRIQPFGHVGFNIAHSAQSPYLGMSPSMETRAKRSAALTGRSNPSARKPKSESTRAKISASCREAWQRRIDRTVSPESRVKKSLALKGRKQSEETCAKKSAALKGKPKNARSS